MKGMVFTILEDMTIQNFGLEAWQTVLDKVNPPSQGIYTSSDTYPDEEFLNLVTALSEEKKISKETLTQDFGYFMFPYLAKKFPVFLKPEMTLKEFLKSIEGIIHVEVKKLFPEAGLPTFRYEEPSPNQLIMFYQSPRKLCHLAMGLILAAADHFNNPIKLQQTSCMHQGGKHCRLEIEFL
jgi:predicted hydrocarbon binding protein